MDYSTLATIVLWMVGAGVGGLAWIFKLQGDVRVLKSDLTGESLLRQSLESRVNGIEERIFEELQAIRLALSVLATRQ